MNFSISSALDASRHRSSIVKINSNNLLIDKLRPPAFERSGAASERKTPDQFVADSIRLQSRNIHTGISLLRNDPRFRGRDLPIVSFAINQILNENGIPHRFGGSLAGALHGGRKMPVDIDMEVDDKRDLKDALDTLSHFDDQVEMPDGTVVHMRGKRMGFRLFEGNAGGMIKMVTTHADGREDVTWVDVTNVNHHRMIGGLNSPNSGAIAKNSRRPNYLSPQELIANYLDRMLRKPRQSERKNDCQQIVDIMHKLNFDPKKNVRCRVDGSRDFIFCATRQGAKVCRSAA